jgi:hypothetical protein
MVVSLGLGVGLEADPQGDDSKKGKSNGKCRRRFPSGMTTRKARATASTTADPCGMTTRKAKASANADSLREMENEKVCCGNGETKGMATSKCRAKG